MSRAGERAHHAATGVGVATGLIGAGLLAMPSQSGALVGIRDDSGLRIVGAVDVLIAVGILRGRPRWPWLVIRASVNPPIGAYFAIRGRRSAARSAQALGAGIAAAAILDARIATDLRRDGR